MKKYFLKDTTLENIDDDKFRYQDFANNLRNIIEYNKSPFNIAIIGKWGLGKSSLINMALAPLRKKEKEYLLCDINAWKYEKDEIGKAFLKELWEGISKKKVLSFSFFHKDYNDVVKKMFEDEELLSEKNSLFVFLKFLAITFVFSALFFCLYCWLSNDFYGVELSGSNFWISSLLRYCKNIGSILIIPLVVWLGKLFMDKLNTPVSRNYEISFPLETQADYEIYLKKLLDNHYVQNRNLKIIVTIDDLDRLSAEKIVEALDALKIFMEYDKFIFIVPFDDEILKNALARKRIQNISTKDNEYDGEMVLDKLFQYKIYLPQLIKTDMRKYAFEICKNDCIDFVKEYCNNDYKMFNDIVGKILIHNDVSTPRQVKKIINAFIENVMVTRDREYANKVSKGFATEVRGLQMIAKVSVLQSDYNVFYDLLFKDTNAIHEILEVHRSNGKQTPSELLANYFASETEGYVLKRKYDSLVNFLIFTEHLGYNNITPYLYMAQTEAGVLVGDKKQQDFMAAIGSCNLITIRQFISDTPLLASFFIEQLKYEEASMSGNMIISAIACYDILPEKDKEELAVAVVERIPGIVKLSSDFRYDLLNSRNLVSMCKLINSDRYNELVEYALIQSRNNEDAKKMIVVLNEISLIKEELCETIKEKFNQFIKQWIMSDSTEVTDILEYTASEGISYISTTCGKEYIGKIVKQITENDDFNESMLDQLGEVIKYYLEKYSIKTIEEVLKTCFAYPKLYYILDKTINKNKYREIEDAKEMAKQIISVGVAKLKGVFGFNILAKLKYSIDNEDRDLFDNFFRDSISRGQFADMIGAFVIKNTLEVLPQTIEELTQYTFEEEGYAPDIRRILKFFTKEQSKKFWVKFENACKYSMNSEYEILKGLIVELSKSGEYKEVGEIITSTIIPNMDVYYTKHEYLMFAIQAVSAYKERMNQESIDRYSKILIKAISIETENIINAYRGINMWISESVWCSNLDTLIKYVSKSTYAVIYDIVTMRRQLFNEKNDNLNQLVTFLVDYIKFSDTPNDVINEISKKFKKISNLEKLIHELMDIEYDEKNASIKLAKFMDDFNINQVIDIVNNEWNADDVRKRKLIALFSESNKYSKENILNYISENSGEVGKNDLLTMLLFCESFISENNMKNFTSISEYLLDNYFEKDVCIQIQTHISGFSINSINSVRERICVMLTNMFKNSSSEEIRRKAAILIKDKGLSRKVRNKFNDKELAEYRSYL